MELETSPRSLEPTMTPAATLKFLLAFLLLSTVCHGQAPSRQNAIQAEAKVDPDGLVESARSGNLRAVESIVAAGVDVNAKSRNGETALVAAASNFNKNDELVEFLLTRGARVDDRSVGFSAIFVDAAFSLYQQPSKGSFCGNLVVELWDIYSKGDRLGLTPLLVAASAGRSKLIRLLLDRGADIEASTFEGATPLMLASLANDPDSIRMLLESGANVNAAASKGETALMLASWSGTWIGGTDPQTYRLEAVRLLVEAGARVNAREHSGLCALMGAAEIDNLGVARFLLSKGAEVNARSNFGSTALMRAAYAGNVEMLKLLLNAGADLKARNDKGVTVLREAVAVSRKPQTLATLLNSPANLEEKQNNKGVGMALQLGELLDRYYATELLEQAGVTLSDSEALILAIYWRQPSKVQPLLAKGANANARGTGGRPVLMYAAKIDDPDVIRLLIEKGADLNARDDIGQTALMEAATEGSTHVARALVESGADVNAKSDAGTTALINAAWRGRVEIVRLLIGRGADVNAQTKSGNTALERSQYCGENKVEIARLLKEAGATR
jgi:ankyrin repeat protein